MRALLGAALLASTVMTATDDASAFSTRVHILFANKVRDAVVAGNGTVELWQGGTSVTLLPEDREAIINEPEAFRAGAVGPDNIMFPGLTDPSHAIEQRPFEQCERLYQSAVLERERAYALGCFLHGASDAVGHHYVNFMTGETFTLNPITSSRAQSFDNVVRHIIAEDMIQDALAEQSPSEFSSARLGHEIPKGFVVRSYFDSSSPVYELLSYKAINRYNGFIEDNPSATLLDVVLGVQATPAEQLVLLPIYRDQIEATRDYLREYLFDEIATMQDFSSPEGSQLLILPGPDGVLGTSDDDADCSVSCAQAFVKYFVFVGLTEPRYDAGGNELPSAWDKVSDKFSGDLEGLSPAMVDVIENVSARLNQGLDQGGIGISELDPADLEQDFDPLVAWAEDITTIDTMTIALAVSPQWLNDLEVFFQGFGLDVNVVEWVEAILEPVLQPIRDGIRAFVIEQAKEFVGDLVTQYKAQLAAIDAEYRSRLMAVRPEGASGDTFLDEFYASGLYGHTFNVMVVALADHRAILPVGDDLVGIGPASFDCSHTPKWMQVGACPYLAEVVFPLGLEVNGLVSLRKDGENLMSSLEEDSPVECHDGSLSAFAAEPRPETCELVSLGELVLEKEGTVSRGVPPELSPMSVQCQYLTIDGLPEPPEGAGGSGNGGGSTGSGDANGGGGEGAGEDGCDCRAASTGGGRSGALALVLAGLLLLRLRRRVGPAVASVMVLSACSDDGATSSGGAGGASSSSSTSGGNGGDASAGGAPQGGGPGSGGEGPGSGGANAGDALEAELRGTVWNGLQDRDGKDRAYEISFHASERQFGEIRNPFGPARNLTYAEFEISPNGETMFAVDEISGEVSEWGIELVSSNPRTLRLSKPGGLEVFTEGYWTVPETGLTAEVRVFPADGVVANAYCKASSFQCEIDYDALFGFARGENVETPLESDIAGGVELLSWYNVPNFTVTDVEGFGFDSLGGTLLSDQYNFVVRYTGWVEHPGGALSMREQDDDVGEFSATGNGGVWAFVGDDTGVGGFDELFLGVNAFGFCSEGSTDEPVVNVTGSGFVPIEIIMVRCNTDGPPVDAEMKITSGPWLYVGEQPTAPDVSLETFPLPF